jgi:hypothetical protein
LSIKKLLSMRTPTPAVGAWLPVSQTQPPLVAVYMGGKVWRIVSLPDGQGSSPES